MWMALQIVAYRLHLTFIAWLNSGSVPVPFDSLIFLHLAIRCGLAIVQWWKFCWLQHLLFVSEKDMPPAVSVRFFASLCAVRRPLGPSLAVECHLQFMFALSEKCTNEKSNIQNRIRAQPSASERRWRMPSSASHSLFISLFLSVYLSISITKRFMRQVSNEIWVSFSQQLNKLFAAFKLINF